MEQKVRSAQVIDANSSNLDVLLTNVNANANAAYAEANLAYLVANTANATANLALPIAGGTITGNLTILQNAYINGDLNITGNLIVGNTLTANIVSVSVIQGNPTVKIIGLAGINSSN